mmetsp:Transcript_32483/g.67874  ORF Transcript_32483/g.67874 Transcript_32483/m.67874 type:complete len:215 (+) Transcript_32483:1131-1775(+)
MLVLCREVARKQSEIRIAARSVANQAAVYLAALYLAVVPFLASEVYLQHNRYSEGGVPGNCFWFLSASVINFSVFGLWTTLGYRYFSIEKNFPQPRPQVAPATGGPRTSGGGADNNAPAAATTTTTDAAFIFQSREIRPETSDGGAEQKKGTERTQPTGEEEPPIPEQPRYSFNIFDGTNATGAFAEFVFDGDEDDEEADNEETRRWSAVQGHV